MRYCTLIVEKYFYWGTKYCLSTFTLVAFLSCHSAFAQTKPNFNQYLFNYYLINPAVAGIEDYVDVKSSIRSQWNGLEGSPETVALTIHGNIERRKKSGSANPVKEKQASFDDKSDEINDYNAKPHHGFGAMFLADRIGPFSKMQFNGSYAYHIPINKKYRLAAGVSFGIIQNRLDQDKISLHDPNDLAVYGERYTNLNPDLGLGVWFYSRSLFVGLSGAQLLKYNQTFGDYTQAEKESYRHFIITGGYKFITGYDVVFTPSISVKWLSPAPIVVDYNIVVSFINRVSLGFTYRSNNEFVLSSRFIVSPLIEIGYSFDYGSAAVDRYNYGSHEIFVGFRLRNKYKVLCPVHL